MKDSIEEATETTLRIYGCDLIQENGFLLRLPQAVMATGQVLFHCLYCNKSFARFNMKKVAASCVWTALKLEECPRKARQVIIVFHRMECRRENLPIEHLDLYSKKYLDLKMELSRTERHILKEMAFYLYAAARRFQVPLLENPPWWKAFDAEKSGIDEVCRVLAHLYSLPKAHYIPVCKDGDSFTFANKSSDSQSQPLPEQEVSQSSPLNSEVSVSKAPPIAANLEGGESKGMLIKVGMDKLKEDKKGDDELKSMPSKGEAKQEPMLKSRSERRTEASGVDKSKERDRIKATDRDRGRDSHWERVREEADRDRDKVKDRSNRSKDRTKDSGGHSERDRDNYSSYSSREKDLHRHHSYS